MKERKFISESVKKLLVTEFIRSETESAGFGGMEMKRTPFGTNITLYVNKPGLVIGRRGGKIQEITAALEKKFGVETPQIEVKEVPKPDLNPMIVSKKIAISLEKGWLYRKAGNTTLRRTVENDAKGVLIKIAGKISGERARSQKFIYGSVKYSGEPGREGMAHGFSTAKLKQGVIGVSVRILDPEYKLPDQIEISKDPVIIVKPAKEEEVVPEVPPKSREPAPSKEELPVPKEEKKPEKPVKQPRKTKKETPAKKTVKKEEPEKEKTPEPEKEKAPEKKKPRKTAVKKKEAVEEVAAEKTTKKAPRRKKTAKSEEDKKSEDADVGSKGKETGSNE